MLQTTTMHILEVIIDGFKSYATRTVVSGFDPAFNAITGLNGSGKSNILDAICFVLGISNLSQVRAANLQDLVYKQGQAGVTKASVTIVFDNSEIKSSPVGYEGEKRLCVTREVVVGGRNRYLINGKGAQASSVANLFQSVQLNVNNPHFLIMQGRITKVLNMKPPEILSMVEEAAGTRMFESKKQAALKTLDKKQAKVDEIDRVLAADITPTLERLREEKSHYLRWSANAAEVSRLERFCVAAEYDEAEKNAAVAGEGIVAASLCSRRWRVAAVGGRRRVYSWSPRWRLRETASRRQRRRLTCITTQAPRKPNARPRLWSRKPPQRPKRPRPRRPRRPNAARRTAPLVSLPSGEKSSRRRSTTRRRRSRGSRRPRRAPGPRLTLMILV